MITHIEHTADDGFEVISDSPEHMFREAGNEMLNMLYSPKKVNNREERTIEINSPLFYMLFHNFLAELLQIAQYDKFLIKKIEILKLTQKEIIFKVFGENYNPKCHEFHIEIKAVTYHMLEAEERNGKWFGRVIFDL